MPKSLSMLCFYLFSYKPKTFLYNTNQIENITIFYLFYQKSYGFIKKNIHKKSLKIVGTIKIYYKKKGFY